MTSMLLRLSTSPLLLYGLLHVLLDHVGVRAEPVGHLRERATPYLVDLDQPAPFVVVRRDLERRHQPAEREAGDLLEPALHVLARDLPVGLSLESVADGFDVDRGDQDAAVVVDRGGHLLRRL